MNALPALRREQRDNVVAERDRADPLTDGLHDTRTLMSEHGGRVSRRIDSRSAVHVGVTHTTGDEPDQHLARPWVSQVQLLDDERTGELLQHRGAYPHEAPYPPLALTFSKMAVIP